MVDLDSKGYKPFVCLPFLYLDLSEPIVMGPIRFSPSDRIGGATVSIHPSIRDETRFELLIDSLYLLYFASTFIDLYHTIKPPHFEAFTKIIPVRQKPSEEELEKIDSISSIEENLYHLVYINSNMQKGLGEALNLVYLKGKTEENEKRYGEMKRLIRSIRYFIHCFYEKFQNLVEKGLDFSPHLYEPEDALFLYTAFESLFDIDPLQAPADFKQKLRPVLQLKFGKPIEVIWKWVDGFYAMKNHLVHTGEVANPLFLDNENFSVPYLVFAVKLFIYSVYYKLTINRMIAEKRDGAYAPWAFKGVEREEVVGMLWPEAEILKKIALLIMQVEQGKISEEYLVELKMLGKIYIHTLKTYYFRKDKGEDIAFIPAANQNIENFVEAILSRSGDEVEIDGTIIHISDLYPDELIPCLQKRVA